MNGSRILVVDDENSIRALLTQCLDEAGYIVVSAVDGEHALKKAEEEAFDLVLLDMKLPGLDGLQVLRKLRSIKPGQLVVIITAHGTIETAVEAMKQGATDYLQKPFTPDEIRAIVQHTLTRKLAVPLETGSDFAHCLAEARDLLAKGRLSDANQFLRRAINLDPNRPEPYNLLGASAEHQGDMNGARRMYRVALALDPSYEPAVRNLDRVSQWQYDFQKQIDLGQAGEEAEARR
ncbi:MAG: response regulator [Bacteroidota bacterium]